LIRNDKSDLLILKQTKDAVRVSICHTGTVIANGFMHCGTTHDSFLLDNLEWLSRATNWLVLNCEKMLAAKEISCLGFRPLCILLFLSVNGTLDGSACSSTSWCFVSLSFFNIKRSSLY
jgi:hypothetical protein